jgi:16S rRNA processing protein RimM
MAKRPVELERKPARLPGEYLAVGRIVRPHGIRGALVVSAYSDILRSMEPGAEIRVEGRARPFHVRSCGTVRGRNLLELEELDDREGADALRGLEISISVGSAPSLPSGTYYQWQILGLQVRSTAGDMLGKIVEILETGANDVYIVRDDDGREILLPAIDDVVKEVDLEGGRMVVALIPGLLRPE